MNRLVLELVQLSELLLMLLMRLMLLLIQVMQFGVESRIIDARLLLAVRELAAARHLLLLLVVHCSLGSSRGLFAVAAF